MRGLPVSARLPDGQRLHLNHGPIDLIIGAEGPERDEAFEAASERFQTVLTGLVAELDGLKTGYQGQAFSDPIAQRMAEAVAIFAEDTFVTAMAAVAGAVADEMLQTVTNNRSLAKAYVNNGGDIAFHLTDGQTLSTAMPTGLVEIDSAMPVRGIATSGWQGRSNSLGIADAVTVLADNAAMADVAATMIANQVDLPGHPAIKRRPAHEIEAHSELQDLLVTTDVGDLTPAEIDEALDRGADYAKACVSRGLIEGAMLALKSETRVV